MKSMRAQYWKQTGRDLISGAGLICFAAGCSSAPAEQGKTGGTEHEFLPVEDGAVTAAVSGEPQRDSRGSELVARSNSVESFRWTKGQTSITLRPHGTHVCALSMVRGELANNTSLHISKSGANWTMQGGNFGSNTLQIEAVCEPFSVFRVNSGRTVAMAGDFEVSTPTTHSFRVRNLPANTAPVFTGLIGRFEGRGERAGVTQIPTLEVYNETQGGTHAASASVLSFGLASGERVFYSDEFPSRSISIGNSYKAPFAIAPLASNYCYLSWISGDFNGADEWVQVFPNRTTGQWTLAANSGSGNGITARAECILTDQRHVIIDPPR